ncbi:MAG: DUF512 domain-containing protein [Clostridia bacterium]|nr:DUF512 domain-containing protein [Clostridia bacterium]
MVTVTGVQPFSIAEKAGIKAGESIVSVNKNNITDLLDYRFYCTEKKLNVLVCDQNGKQRKVKIRKDQYDDLGLEFETYLMDKQRSCRNNCIFCFIDQLPKGLRETLYFKDDDTRLSFLFGNYITLTNITEDEIDRIIKMRISPVNISVHTTNPELRVKMMKNKFAGEVLRYIDKLAAADIKINCQLVLCKGINDGEELKRSISDLAKLYPAVESIAAVPVGLTKHREGLYPLEPFDEQSAAEVIDIINEFGDAHFEKTGDRLVYPADEFFALAKREMPNEGYYGAMLQLENGVGMTALMKSEFQYAVDESDEVCCGNKKTIATGKGAYTLIKSLVDYAKRKWHNIDCEVVAIENEFFGPLITTTGLITGTDLINQLKTRENIGTLLISRCMLRREGDMFLDDVTLDELSQQLGVSVSVVDNDGAELLAHLLK